MSHADDGTLHAYLDGELSALEVARLEAHLADCAPCHARLHEARDVVARSTRILALAEPPERAAPPLHQLRHPRLAWRLRVPLAWAASALIVITASWLAIGIFASRSTPESAVADAPPPAPSTLAIRAPDTPTTVAAVPPPEPSPAQPTTLAAGAPPTADSLAAGGGLGALAARAMRDTATLERVALEARAERDLAAAPGPGALEFDSARAVLGGEIIHAIDGVAILALRHASGAVIVEQEVAPGVVVRLRHEVERAARSTLSAREGATQIVGRVTDATSGAPIPSAYVAITGTARGAITSARGTYVIDSVPPGTYALVVRILGYEPLEVATAQVDSGRTTVADFALRQFAVALEEVVVTGVESRGRQVAAPAANAAPDADLVRRLGRLRIGISGPLPPDSLASLLRQVRPVP